MIPLNWPTLMIRSFDRATTYRSSQEENLRLGIIGMQNTPIRSVKIIETGASLLIEVRGYPKPAQRPT